MPKQSRGKVPVNKRGRSGARYEKARRNGPKGAKWIPQGPPAGQKKSIFDCFTLLLLPVGAAGAVFALLKLHRNK